MHGCTPIAACAVVQVDSSHLVLGRKIAHHMELDDSDGKQFAGVTLELVCKFWKSKFQ